MSPSGTIYRIPLQDHRVAAVPHWLPPLVDSGSDKGFYEYDDPLVD